MNRRSKLLSCLISALVFNSFCYCMEKKVPTLESNIALWQAMNELGLTRAIFRSVSELEKTAAKFSAAAAKEKDPTKKRQLEIYAIIFAEDAINAAASKEKKPSSPQPTPPTLAQVKQAKKLIADA